MFLSLPKLGLMKSNSLVLYCVLFYCIDNSVVFLSPPQFDGSKMSPDYRVPPIVVYERKDSKWTLKDKHT